MHDVTNSFQPRYLELEVKIWSVLVRYYTIAP